MHHNSTRSCTKQPTMVLTIDEIKAVMSELDDDGDDICKMIQLSSPEFSNDEYDRIVRFLKAGFKLTKRVLDDGIPDKKVMDELETCSFVSAWLTFVEYTSDGIDITARHPQPMYTPHQLIFQAVVTSKEYHDVIIAMSRNMDVVNDKSIILMVSPTDLVSVLLYNNIVQDTFMDSILGQKIRNDEPSVHNVLACAKISTLIKGGPDVCNEFINMIERLDGHEYRLDDLKNEMPQLNECSQEIKQYTLILIMSRQKDISNEDLLTIHVRFSSFDSDTLSKAYTDLGDSSHTKALCALQEVAELLRFKEDTIAAQAKETTQNVPTSASAKRKAVPVEDIELDTEDEETAKEAALQIKADFQEFKDESPRTQKKSKKKKKKPKTLQPIVSWKN